jgi:hypothetical protein
MIRYFLAKGDRAGSAVIVEGLSDCSCSNPPPRVEIATLYMKTYCKACKREGFVAPKGPRWPGTASNGKQWALSGDVNVCGCNPPPVFYAERGMKMTFTAKQAETLVASYSGLGKRSSEDDFEELEHFFEIVDARTEQPIDGMTYKVSSGNQTLINDATLAGGRTRAFSTEHHPNLSFVAWRKGDVR